MLREGVVCVAGPPGAGKTTLVGHLVAAHGGSTFRLREALTMFRIEDDPANSDPLGWASDTTVARVLELAAEQGQFHVAAQPLILDNFPGSTEQLQLLQEWASRWRLGLGVLELTANDSVLLDRVKNRRVCPRCDPDLHSPSTVVHGAVPRCRACGSRVVPRSSDRPETHALRVERYRTNNQGLAATAETLGIPHRRVDATRTFDEVHQSALDAYAVLLTPGRLAGAPTNQE